jgi:hypothetical protein
MRRAGRSPAPEPREAVDGAAKVLALADTMRAAGGAGAHRLYCECEDAAARGELASDMISRLYRHAMIHAGGIVRQGGEPFRVCPVCEVRLGRPEDG